MRLKITTILARMLLPMISLAQRQQYQQVNDIQYTIDQYAPLTYVRPDAPPIVIISGDRE